MDILIIKKIYWSWIH